MSLTELAFIVVFVVLLLLGFSRDDTEAREKEQRERIEKNQALIERDEGFRRELFAAAPETDSHELSLSPAPSHEIPRVLWAADEGQ